MSRETYGLSEETRQVLAPEYQQPIASEMDCEYNYINGIYNRHNSDPYPKFRRLFRAAVRAGARAEIWLNDLSGIFVKARTGGICQSELSAKLLDKIQDDAKSLATLVESLKDGKLDKRECHEILAALAQNQETNERLEMIVQHRLGEINEAAGVH